MTALIILACIAFYIGIGSWMFGYVRGTINEKGNGWETPLPLVSGLFWPITLTIISLTYLMVPAQRMGFAFQQAKVKKQRKRIAEQEKIRIQLKENAEEIARAEKELDQEFKELDEKENQLRQRGR